MTLALSGIYKINIYNQIHTYSSLTFASSVKIINKFFQDLSKSLTKDDVSFGFGL